ncbi:MAG TPA: hypothetical protein VG345_03740 [Bryobacteraceae bacterium]|jgi:hypothetical protein|nr:hypothetical protein [Bryobacteraceae bacterium]
MKKPLLLTFAMAALSATALFGQTFVGTWQGALKPKRELVEEDPNCRG